MLQAAGKRITDKHRGEVRETLVALQSTAQESNRLEAAKCLGLLCGYLPDDELCVLLKVNNSSISSYPPPPPPPPHPPSSSSSSFTAIATIALQSHVLNSETTAEWSVMQFRATVLSSALQSSATKLLSQDIGSTLPTIVIELATSDRVSVAAHLHYYCYLCVPCYRYQ